MTLQELIVARMTRELSRTSDEGDALRRAIITLAILIGEDADEPTRAFIEHLLLEFPPLAEHFTDHTHPIIPGHKVVCGLTAEGNTAIFLSESFVLNLLGEVENS
jgi:hypothetical protein